MSSRIVTLPNLLTVFRMVLIPVLSRCFSINASFSPWQSLFLAGVTDGLDGLLARRFNQKSQLGTILDPIADKLMLVTAFVVLSMRSAFPQPLPSHLPVPLGNCGGHQPRRLYSGRGCSNQYRHRFPRLPALDAGQNQHLRSRSSPLAPLFSPPASPTAPATTCPPSTRLSSPYPSFPAPITSSSSPNY